MKTIAAIAFAAVLCGCETEAEKRAHEIWDGAVVVKICRSGMHIYRLKSGEFRTGGWGTNRVENPETVCE